MKRWPVEPDAYKELEDKLDGWFILVRDQREVVARCTRSGDKGQYGIGLEAGNYSDPDMPGRLKDEQVLLILNEYGRDRSEDYAALAMAYDAGARTVRVWKPHHLGGPDCPDLKTFDETYGLAESMLAAQPWRYEPAPMRPERRALFPQTDMGNAERFASRFGPGIRYCAPWKQWLWWDGSRWRIDQSREVQANAKETVRGIYEEAQAGGDEGSRTAILRWARKSESSARLKAMIEVAESEPGVPILPAHFDKDPWLFNCPNGTIDLRTGRLKDHRRTDMITCINDVEYHPGAECPLWHDFLHLIFDGNDDVIAFVQRILGMGLSGDVSEQILPIFWGEGANGKSTLLNTWLKVLGPYGFVSPPGLLVKSTGTNHPTEKAALFGKRFVVDFEAEGKLNETLVKQLTGGDRITARRMHENFWDFMPTHKILLCTNAKPMIIEISEAIWRRIKFVEFLVQIAEHRRQADFPRQLEAELPGILAWGVRGCLDWVQHGLQTPQIIKDATAEYKGEENLIENFIEDQCITGGELSVRARMLYTAFRNSLKGFESVIPTETAFGRSMRKLGYDRKTSAGRWYLGIALRRPKNSDQPRGFDDNGRVERDETLF
jgi:putative DNA primase/helicase